MDDGLAANIRKKNLGFQENAVIRVALGNFIASNLQKVTDGSFRGKLE